MQRTAHLQLAVVSMGANTLKMRAHLDLVVGFRQPGVGGNGVGDPVPGQQPAAAQHCAQRLERPLPLLPPRLAEHQVRRAPAAAGREPRLVSKQKFTMSVEKSAAALAAAGLQTRCHGLHQMQG